MERVNVTLDDVAKSAGAYLALELGDVGLSAAIRFALVQTAKRKDWRADSVALRRRTPPPPGAADAPTPEAAP